MQIFFLDQNPIVAARALCDCHVIKMPVEALQLIATAHHRLGLPLPFKIDGAPYKPIAQGKELVEWLCEDTANREWLIEYAYHCCFEHVARGGNTLGCRTELGSLWVRLDGLHSLHTPFPRRWSAGAPVDLLNAIEDTTEAYREYYRWKVASKPEVFKWKNNNQPAWMKEQAQ